VAADDRTNPFHLLLASNVRTTACPSYLPDNTTYDTFSDRQTGIGAADWRTGRNIRVAFDSDPFAPLCENMASSTNPEVRNTLQSKEDQATARGNKYRTFGVISMCNFYGAMLYISAVYAGPSRTQRRTIVQGIYFFRRQRSRRNSMGSPTTAPNAGGKIGDFRLISISRNNSETEG